MVDIGVDESVGMGVDGVGVRVDSEVEVDVALGVCVALCKGGSVVVGVLVDPGVVMG